jgi:pyruvate,orthophosphate dikinase
VVAFSAEDAVAGPRRAEGLLVRSRLAEDLHGMKAAVGILTARGGATSTRGGRPGHGGTCVVGCAGISVDYAAGSLTAAAPPSSRRAGNIDGSTARSTAGEVAKIRPPSAAVSFQTLLGWADAARRMKIRTNADTPNAQEGDRVRAEGIGLCG